MPLDQGVDLSCEGGPPELAPRLGDLLGQAVRNLDLAVDLCAVSVTADDFPEPEGAWLHFTRGVEGDARPALQVFCHPDRFCRPNPRTRTILPEREVWEQDWSPHETQVFDPETFSVDRAGRFLYHQLLTARDLVRGDLPSEGIAAHRIEALQAAWAVTVDGRLERLGLPGFGLAERRGRYSRLFSTVGVLLPDHWQIFQALWDGGLVSWREVLAVTDRLPRIRRAV